LQAAHADALYGGEEDGEGGEFGNDFGDLDWGSPPPENHLKDARDLRDSKPAAEPSAPPGARDAYRDASMDEWLDAQLRGNGAITALFYRCFKPDSRRLNAVSTLFQRHFTLVLDAADYFNAAVDSIDAQRSNPALPHMEPELPAVPAAVGGEIGHAVPTTGTIPTPFQPHSNPTLPSTAEEEEEQLARILRESSMEQALCPYMVITAL